MSASPPKIHQTAVIFWVNVCSCLQLQPHKVFERLQHESFEISGCLLPRLPVMKEAVLGSRPFISLMAASRYSVNTQPILFLLSVRSNKFGLDFTASFVS